MNNESVIVQLGVKRESLVVKLEQWCEREGIPFANVMRLADDPASTAISLARKVRMVEAEIDEAQAAGRKDDNEKETSPIQKTDCQFELPSAAMYRLKEKVAEDMMNECVYARLEECSFSTDEHEYLEGEECDRIARSMRVWIDSRLHRDLRNLGDKHVQDGIREEVRVQMEAEIDKIIEERSA